MTKDKLREKINKTIENCSYGFSCVNCGSSGASGQDKCEQCNGTGIVDWNHDISTKETSKS